MEHSSHASVNRQSHDASKMMQERNDATTYGRHRAASTSTASSGAKKSHHDCRSAWEFLGDKNVDQENSIGRFQGGSKRRVTRVLSWHLLVASVLVFRGTCAAEPPAGSVPCGDSDTCLTIVGPGSECIEGLCSNPFVSGCLRHMLGQDTEKPDGNRTSTQILDPTRTLRVCNSQDSPETIANQLCVPSPFDYMEIRILTANWESSLLTAWAMQIVLSEWLHIPTSIESSSPDLQANFYHPTNAFSYGSIAYDYAALEAAHRLGDCTKRNQKNVQTQYADGTYNHWDDRKLNVDLPNVETPEEEEETYVACAHILPEVWNGQTDNLWNLTQHRIIEAPEGNGVVGKLTLYIPKYVAEKRPELAHYSGWSLNRTAIASDFLRPLTWTEYCQRVSSTQCQTPDDRASRPPSEGEGGMYYDTPGGGLGYRGHFYAHDAYRNCTAHPTNCTGDFIDFPCDWSSFAVPQIHHLGIPLESHGTVSVNNAYSYGEKLQIWEAANESQQFVLMNWYTPDPTYQWYRGTAAEFQEVQFPPPSPECVLERVSVEDRCSEDPAVRQGSPRGACGSEVQTLQKVVVQNLYHTIYNPQRDSNGKPLDQKEADAIRSPAYEAVKKFHLSEFDIGRMFEDWRDRLRERGHPGFTTFDGTTGADPRHVACQWVADNAERLQTFVPFTYPRVLQEEDPLAAMTVSVVALVFGIFVAACILCMGLVTFIYRDKDAFRSAQLPFLYMILLGLLAISIGGIVYALAPKSQTCVARIWLVTMGYTLEMSPLIVKIGAISKMLQAAKKMRRVTIPRETLFGVVGGICLLAASYLTAWTIIDPPTKGRQLTLHLDNVVYDDFEETDPFRAWWQVPATPISVSYYCRSSGSPAWFTVGLIWQCLLLLNAAVLAMQTRRIQKRWNESRTLAIMIYTQGGFVMLRFLMWLLEEPSGVSVQLFDVLRSFIFSLDALMALTIYFGSKLVTVMHQLSPDARDGDSMDSRLGGSHRMVSGFEASGILENATRYREESPSVFGQSLTSSSRVFGNSLQWLKAGVVGSSSRAGDLMVSQASSRRLEIAPDPDESEMMSFCPRCRERESAFRKPFRARDDSEIPTAVRSLRAVLEEPEIKSNEPIKRKEKRSTLSTNEDSQTFQG